MADDYSIADYGGMLTDRARMTAYTASLRQAIGPESVVVDIGTGTGIFAMLACALGARRVYAIEPSPLIQVARDSARVNGFLDRIEFLQATSTEVELPKRADIVVSDLRGVLPLSGQHLPTVIDARQRFLRPGGTLIPRRDVLMAVPTESRIAHDGFVAGFRDGALGLDLALQQRLALNSWRTVDASDARALADPLAWYDLDYLTLDTPNAAGRATWQTSREGTAHGVSVWFEAVAAEGISYASGPFRQDSAYGTAFFPFLEPIPLRSGETITVALDARLVGDGYLFRWQTETTGTRFDQSTFHSSPLALAELERRRPSHRPELDSRGMFVREALSLMGEGRSNEEIARSLLERQIGEIDTLAEARHRVGKLAFEYGR